MTEQCLEGTVDDSIAVFFTLPDASVCTLEGACTDQLATSQIVTYMENCQGGLVTACLSQGLGEPCLLELHSRFNADASQMMNALAGRIRSYDISTLSPLLRRRVSDPRRLVPDINCDGTALGSYYDVDPDVFCLVNDSSAARLALLRAHYALDKAGVPR